MASEDTDARATDSESAPQEAFALLGNEVRAEILRVLGETRSGHAVVPFSELRSRVETDVDSSKFNYHLQKLVGRFVVKIDADADSTDAERTGNGSGGYKLRPEGLALYRTIVAGTFTRRASMSPFEVGFDCYFCETPVEATYHDGQFLIRCPGCDHLYNHEMAPPSVTDDERELLARVGQYARRDFLAFVHGVCSTCLNGVDAGFIPAAESPHNDGENLDVLVNVACDRCGAQRYLSVGVALSNDPELISFCYERGLDLTTTPVWELEFAMTDRFTTVRSTDPWEVALEVTLDGNASDGDALELVVDDDLNVVERNRP